MLIVDFLFRWIHVLAGVTWIGMLFYFNFVQAEYFKEASEEGLADAKAKLAPRALKWFRWAAMFTFLSGLLLIGGVSQKQAINDYIVIGMLMGTLMFLNVWFVIWPNQKVVLGLAEGDASNAARKATLASRTNTLFSAPMLFCMLGSSHIGYSAEHILSINGGGLGMWLSIGLIALLQVNALFGKLGPIASIRGVIHMSLLLVPVFFCLLMYL